MEKRLEPVMEQPERPQPKPDLDDLIFQGESWMTSDR